MSTKPQPRSVSCGAACARKDRYDDFGTAVRTAKDRAPKDGRPIYVYRCARSCTPHREETSVTKLTPEIARRFDKLANRVAKRYARRCWWMPEEDLRQEAWIAALDALKSFDPEYGTRLDGYVWCAMVRWLRGFLWRNSAPVTVPRGDDRTAAAGLSRAPLEYVRDVAHSGGTPEDHVVAADRQTKLRESLKKHGLPVLRERPWAVRRARRSYRLWKLWKEG